MGIYFTTMFAMLVIFWLFRRLALHDNKQDRLRERDEKAEQIALKRMEEEQLQSTLQAQEKVLSNNETLIKLSEMNNQLQQEIKANEQRLQELNQQDYPTPEQLENLLFKVGASGYDQTPYKHLMKTYNALHIYPEPIDKEDN